MLGGYFSAFAFVIGVNYMWTIKIYGLVGSPNMGKHTEKYQFNQIRTLFPSIFQYGVHIVVDTWWKYVQDFGDLNEKHKKNISALI